MIERIAKRIWDAKLLSGGGGRTMVPWPNCPEAEWCRTTARYVIDAMRNPTDEMMVTAECAVPDLASFADRDKSPSYIAWNAMIDEALKS